MNKLKFQVINEWIDEELEKPDRVIDLVDVVDQEDTEPEILFGLRDQIEDWEFRNQCKIIACRCKRLLEEKWKRSFRKDNR